MPQHVGAPPTELAARTAAAQMEWERHDRLRRVLLGELRQVSAQLSATVEQLQGQLTGAPDPGAQLLLAEAAGVALRVLGVVNTLEQDWLQAPAARALREV